MMSAVLDFDLTIIGRGGHGARPHDTVDAILVAAQLISQLQTIISRNISPNSRAVLTIGTIAGGTARNVIAGEVQLKGTIRGTTLATVDRIRNRLERLSGGLAAAYGAAIKIKFNACYPVLVNDPEANRIIMETAGALYGKKNVIMISEPSLGGEDFAQYLQISAGAMFRLGVRNRRIGAVYNWHSDRFNADDRAVAVGAAVLAGAVVNFLSGKVD